MSQLFPPYVPDRNEPPKRRFRPVPFRVLIPNLITLLSMCAGLSAIRMAYEGKLELAVYLILIGAVLDSLDGRVARMLGGTSRFGAELDSLSDFLAFGAAPALILYSFSLHEIRSLGWVAALIFTACGALRLARFNVQIDDPNRPEWMANFFTGMPIPLAALVVLLPVYLHFLGLPALPLSAVWVALYTIGVALLMVSTIPVFSGKKMSRVPRDWVLPLFVAAVTLITLLFSHPFLVLSLITLAALASVPLGYVKARGYARAHRQPDEMEPEKPAS